MKMVLLLVAVFLVVGVAGCSKPGIKTVNEVSKTAALHSTKPVAKIGDVAINPKDGAKMVWVPKGEFLMGSNFLFREQPVRKIFLDGYWIYKYEVTVAQYRKFCKETGKKMPLKQKWGWIDSHPITDVSWNDAADYAKWAKASLPTSAQWEKAARGTDGREYPWGNTWDVSKCNEKTKGPLKPQPVGSYPAGVSPYGCMDMAGNVMEWCSDWHGDNYYESAPFRNPTGPADGRYRVIRGGGWYSTLADEYRCACRGGSLPEGGYMDYGFRLVR